MNKSRTDFQRSLIVQGILLCITALLCTSCKREIFISTPEENSAPSTPINVTVYAAHDGAVGLEWAANQESDIKQYNIYRRVSNFSTFRKIGYTNESHYIDYPLSYDTTYTYSVTAVDKLGLESPRSATASGRPYNQDIPTAIYDITANGVNLGSARYIRLTWVPQNDYDIKGYEIYRSGNPEVKVEPASLIGTSVYPLYYDSSAAIAIPYYYKVISVDKGNLKSDYSPVVSDKILQSPTLVYPANNSAVKNLTTFQFKSGTAADAYKLVIQSNELYGTVAEYNIYSGAVNQTITFTVDPVIFTSYKKYFWRIIAYSGGSGEPNSFSPLYNFTFIAE